MEDLTFGLLVRNWFPSKQGSSHIHSERNIGKDNVVHPVEDLTKAFWDSGFWAPSCPSISCTSVILQIGKGGITKRNMVDYNHHPEKLACFERQEIQNFNYCQSVLLGKYSIQATIRRAVNPHVIDHSIRSEGFCRYPQFFGGCRKDVLSPPFIYFQRVLSSVIQVDGF